MFKMGKGFIRIAFTAMDLVSVKAEPIIDTLAFPAGFFNKLLTQRFKCLKLAALNLKVGYDRSYNICPVLPLWASLVGIVIP